MCENSGVYKLQLMEGTDKNNNFALLKQYWRCIEEVKGISNASEETSAIVKKMIFYGIVPEEQKADVFECMGDLEISVENYSKACYWYQLAIGAFSDEVEISGDLLEKRNLALEKAVSEKIKEAPIHWKPKIKRKKSGKKSEPGVTEKEKTAAQFKEMLSRKNVIVHINHKNISKKKCA